VLGSLNIFPSYTGSGSSSSGTTRVHESFHLVSCGVMNDEDDKTVKR
jgi:hypothetical protein